MNWAAEELSVLFTPTVVVADDDDNDDVVVVFLVVPSGGRCDCPGRETEFIPVGLGVVDRGGVLDGLGIGWE